MKTIFTILIFTYFIVGAQAQEARRHGMNESAFSTLKENLTTSLDTSKIDMLKNLNSETFSSYQVKEILDLFSLGNYRVEAFKIISSQIEDSENKSVIMSAFQNDLSNYKTDAYKIYNSIKVTKKKEATENATIPLSGNVSLLKQETNCANDENTFTMDDKVIFSFNANKAVEATSLQIWISECKNQNDQSCYTPFSKSAKDILPDWRGFKYENPVPLKQLLSNDGSNKVPTRNNWYHFAVIIKNKIAAEKVFQINKTCE
jgi:hypothetical protein